MRVLAGLAMSPQRAVPFSQSWISGKWSAVGRQFARDETRKHELVEMLVRQLAADPGISFTPSESGGCGNTE